jgi:ubiquinone/menaquinone biosynthesis C-methylase UbiE
VSFFSLTRRVPEASAVEPKALAFLYEVTIQAPFVRTARRNWIASALDQGVEQGYGLDVGTGPGIMAIEIASQRPRLRMVGLDLAAHMVERAKKKAARTTNGRAALWPQGDGHHLPFASGSFDLVISSFAMHHWEDPLEVLNEIARVLKPGGRYYVADVCRKTTWLQRMFAYGSIPFVSLAFGSYSGYGGYYESVRAGYTREEAEALLAQSDLPPGQVGTPSTLLLPVLTISSTEVD